MYNIEDNEKIYCYTVLGWNDTTKQYELDFPKTILFPTKKDLILFLAAHSNYNNDTNLIDCAYFNQNICGTDCYHQVSYKYDYWNDSYSYKYIDEYIYRTYVFIDNNDRIIDIRQFQDEIINCLISYNNSIPYYLYNYTRPYYKHKYRRYGKYKQGRQRHTTCAWGAPKHGYMNKKTAYDEIYYDDYYDHQDTYTNIICANTYKYKVKPRNKRYINYWWDDFRISARSSGWKDKKYRHQWEHNVVNKFKHVQNKKRKQEKYGSEELIYV